MSPPWACPVCRAQVESGTRCRRCRADLSLLCAVEARREAVLAEGRDRLFAGEEDAALAAAEEARQLRDGEDAVRLAAVACLMAGDFPSAWELYQSLFTFRASR